MATATENKKNRHPNAETLAAYADGELPAELVGRVEAHLADCAACRQELESYRALGAPVSPAERVPAAELEADRQHLLQRLRATQPFVAPAPLVTLPTPPVAPVPANTDDPATRPFRQRSPWRERIAYAAALVLLALGWRLDSLPEQKIVSTSGPVSLTPDKSRSGTSTERIDAEFSDQILLLIDQPAGADGPFKVRLLKQGHEVLGSKELNAKKGLIYFRIENLAQPGDFEVVLLDKSGNEVSRWDLHVSP